MSLLPDHASPECHVGRYRFTSHPNCDRGEFSNLSLRMHRKSRVEQNMRKMVPLVCVFSSHPFWTSSSLDVPAGVTQEEGHTGFLIHLPSAVRALIFVARRIQPFLSLVDREVDFCVLTN